MDLDAFASGEAKAVHSSVALLALNLRLCLLYFSAIQGNANPMNFLNTYRVLDWGLHLAAGLFKEGFL